MAVRAGLIGLVGLLLAFQVLRSASVPDREGPGPWAERLWPGHPAVELDHAMAQVGADARTGQSPSPETLRQLQSVAAAAPLAPEPFLVQGALAQVGGKATIAERMFAEARYRDPRSPAARYFLADRYLRTGRTEEALVEMAVMSRLVRGAAEQFAPALAVYARSPGAVPHLRNLFTNAPDFAPVLLNQLAKDARNADLVMNLAESGPRLQGPIPAWHFELVRRLVEAGQFPKARAVWAKLAGVRPEGFLFNPGFEKVDAPPPFNWSYASGGGVADPQAGGKLQLIYFGRTNAVMAEQTLVLPPGRYELRMNVAGTLAQGSGLSWSVTCLPQESPVLDRPLDRTGAFAAAFTVPAGCRAQRLRLLGAPPELAQSSEVTISAVQLARSGGA